MSRHRHRAEPLRPPLLELPRLLLSRPSRTTPARRLSTASRAGSAVDHDVTPAHDVTTGLDLTSVRAGLASRLAAVPRPAPRLLVAAGVGIALVGVGTTAVLWPDGDSGAATQAVVLADESLGAPATSDALKAAAAARVEERTTRDRTRTEPPATPSTESASVTVVDDPTTKAVPDVVGKLWTTTQVNVRSGPSADEKAVARLKALTRVGVTGETKSGWTQVVTDGTVGWVRSTYLAKTKPSPKSASTPSGVPNGPCKISTSIEPHLTANARAVYRAVCALYGGPVKSFGGYRAGDDGDHGTGRAVDIMVSGDPGWDVARYVQAHAAQFNVTYVIYQQKIWLVGKPKSEWRPMEDRGSTTANHYDHVHVSVE